MPPPEPTRRSEQLWLQPYPDALLDDLPDTAPGPEARYESREALATAVGHDPAPPPRSPREREIIDRFVDAFESADAARLVALLTDDAWMSMPPEPLEYQPAFGYFLQDPHAPVDRANGLIVLTLAGDKISAITRFGDNSLFPHFGLPRTLRD